MSDGTFDFGEARITFVGPTRTLNSENNNSPVLRMELGNTVFLFPGDVEHGTDAPWGVNAISFWL